VRSVFDVAVKLLAGRAKSRSRLEAALVQRGYSAEEIASTLQRVTELGYLDDQRYALEKIRTALEEGRALADIVRRLEADGIAEAEAVVRQAAEGHDETKAARILLAKKKLTGVRAARFLAGRGYGEDVIRSVVGELED
jgi:regulatory protein